MEAPLMHLALVGTPNSGKTALFNALTGSRQKVAIRALQWNARKGRSSRR
jgi:predicted GTPase